MKNRNFALLLAGQGISQIGDKFHMIALAIWVLKTTGSSAKMGLVMAASIIPALIIGFFGGVIIDRYPRKWILVATDAIRGVLLVFFAWQFLRNAMRFEMVLVMQVLLSVNAAFFDPAVPAVIPTLVRPEDLAKANSQHQLVNSLSLISGAFLGGVFVSAFGFFPVFAVNAVSFLLSAILECFIDIPFRKAEPKGDGHVEGMRSQIKSGYQYILKRQVLLILLLMVMVIHFFVGSIEVFMPVIAEKISSFGARTLGLFQGAFGIGGVIAGFFLSRTDISGKEKFTLFSSVCIIGLLYATGCFFPDSGRVSLMAYAGMMFFSGGCIILAGVSFKTLLQKAIDDAFAGRVFALAGSLGNASIPLAMMIYGFLLEKYGFQGLLLASGLVLMAVSIVSQILYREKENDFKADTIKTQKAG